MRHIGGKLPADLLILLQLLLIPPELFLLEGNPAEQGAQLLIGNLFQRVLQINLVQRPGQPGRQPGGQQQAQQDRQQGHHQYRLQHPHQQHPDSVPGGGEAQDRPIRQQTGMVKQLLRQGVGIAGAVPLAGGQGLADLLPVQVIVQIPGGRAVIEHRAVGCDPGQAAIRQLEAIKILHALGHEALGHEALGSQIGLNRQLPPLQLSKIVIEYAHDQHQRGQQHGNGRQADGTENFLCHSTCSIL